MDRCVMPQLLIHMGSFGINYGLKGMLSTVLEKLNYLKGQWQWHLQIF